MISFYFILNIINLFVVLVIFNFSSYIAKIKRDVQYYLINIITIFGHLLSMQILFLHPILFIIIGFICLVINITFFVQFEKNIKKIIISSIMSLFFWPSAASLLAYTALYLEEILGCEKL